MLTLSVILRDLKNVPVNRLEDLYAIIRSFQTTLRHSEKKRNDILSFAGAFSSMSQNDYNDFREETKTRNKLFANGLHLQLTTQNILNVSKNLSL